MTITTSYKGETLEVNKKDLVPLQLVEGEAQHFDVEIEGAGSCKVMLKNKAVKASVPGELSFVSGFSKFFYTHPRFRRILI